MIMYRLIRFIGRLCVREFNGNEGRHAILYKCIELLN